MWDWRVPALFRTRYQESYYTVLVLVVLRQHLNFVHTTPASNFISLWVEQNLRAPTLSPSSSRWWWCCCCGSSGCCFSLLLIVLLLCLYILLHDSSWWHICFVAVCAYPSNDSWRLEISSRWMFFKPVELHLLLLLIQQYVGFYGQKYLEFVLYDIIRTYRVRVLYQR